MSDHNNSVGPEQLAAMRARLMGDAPSTDAAVTINGRAIELDQFNGDEAEVDSADTVADHADDAGPRGRIMGASKRKYGRPSVGLK